MGMKDDFSNQDALDCCLVCGPNCVCCIRASGACVEFDGNLVLDDVSFSVGSGVLSALVGPNAGGKSTLFNAIAGVQEIVHGSIYVNGLSPKDSRGSISYIPQRENVNWRFSLTAEEVVNLGLVKNTSMFGFSKKKNSKMVESALERVNMLQDKNQLISEMSGGQRQRVFIARALCQQANILLLDEAFSGVDVASQFGLIDTLRDLRNEGKTIIIATHDLNTLADRFDEVICLNRHVCAQGPPDTTFTPEVLEELYGSHPGMFYGHSLGHHHD
tara:strand:+ start:1609 stop:2427 length:819 start_codon:yes stop_codon:yes gene_type:complete